MEFGEELNLILKKLCSRLKQDNMQYCLAGGWAVSMMGITRTTIDIDLLMILDENTKKKVVSILENSFKLIQSHEHEMEFKKLTIWRNIVSLKDKAELFMIDLLKADSDYLKGVISRAVEVSYEGIDIPVIAIEDLIVLKLTSFRKQDQVDIENLVSSATPINWSYLETTVKSLQLDWDFIEQMRK